MCSLGACRRGAGILEVRSHFQYLSEQHLSLDVPNNVF